VAANAPPFHRTRHQTVAGDVAKDGRFLMITLDPQPERTDVVIIRNWVQHALARVAEAQR
jgi:hypothetical protein